MTPKKATTIQIAATAALLAFMAGTLLRSVMQRVDAIIIIGFGIGTAAAYELLRTAIIEHRDARREQKENEQQHRDARREQKPSAEQ